MYDIDLIQKYRAIKIAEYKNPPNQDIVSKLFNIFIPLITQATLTKTKTPLPDLSVYTDPATIDLSTYIQNGVPAIICRSSFGSAGIDGKCDYFVTKAKQFGLYTGIYHWCDPMQSISNQMDFFSTQIDKYNPSFIALDCEQWWSDWSTWEQAVNGKIPWSQVKVIDSATLSRNYKLMYDAIHAKYPNLKLLVYSGFWFIPEYSPQMESWVKNCDSWMASYIARPNNPKSWADFWNIINSLTQPYRINLSIRELIWQFTSSINQTDWNIFNGSVEDFINWIGSTITPSPIPTPPPVVFTAYKLNANTYYQAVRSGPGKTYSVLSYLDKTNTVYEYARNGSWIKISKIEEKWTALSGLMVVK